MSYALNIRAEGYPRDVGPFPTREAAETWMAGRQLTGSWNTYPITPPEQAEPRTAPCLQRHSHPDPAYMCMAPKGHR